MIIEFSLYELFLLLYTFLFPSVRVATTPVLSIRSSVPALYLDEIGRARARVYGGK